jgi:hypothetical protein
MEERGLGRPIRPHDGGSRAQPCIFFYRRRALMGLLVGGTVAWPLAALAQRPAMPVIRQLGSGTAEAYGQFLAPLRDGLAEAGYVEGRDVLITRRLCEPAALSDVNGHLDLDRRPRWRRRINNRWRWRVHNRWRRCVDNRWGRCVYDSRGSIAPFVLVPLTLAMPAPTTVMPIVVIGTRGGTDASDQHCRAKRQDHAADYRRCHCANLPIARTQGPSQWR